METTPVSNTSATFTDNMPVTEPSLTSARLAPLGLLTAHDLEQMLNVSHDTITRAIQRGQLPPPLILGNQRVWALDAVKQYFVRRQEAAIAAEERKTAKQDAKVASLYGGGPRHGRRS